MTMKRFHSKNSDKRPDSSKHTPPKGKLNPSDSLYPMRLNKYIAKSGKCSRRVAAEWVKQGHVTVNGLKEINPAILISKSDKVTAKGEFIKPVDVTVYVLLNKPKGFITTTSDEQGRKTVMDLIKGVEERIYPVGRLDRNTTGLLLLTNDGEMAQRLSHPSSNTKKVYHVVLDKEISDPELNQIMDGLELEDGLAMVDAVSHIRDRPNNEVGIELHIGKNRIVRRIFESLGYKVERLDRTYYAGLTKKNLGRGRFRHLDEREIRMLKHFS